jgi:acyl-CoA synthetase (AMP-forming)/AMP-acid ligase II
MRAAICSTTPASGAVPRSSPSGPHVEPDPAADRPCLTSPEARLPKRPPARTSLAASRVSKPTRDSLLAHLAEHFAKWRLPDDAILVDSPPMTATGKVRKKDLRAKYRDHLMDAKQV